MIFRKTLIILLVTIIELSCNPSINSESEGYLVSIKSDNSFEDFVISRISIQNDGFYPEKISEEQYIGLYKTHLKKGMYELQLGNDEDLNRAWFKGEIIPFIVNDSIELQIFNKEASTINSENQCLWDAFNSWDLYNSKVESATYSGGITENELLELNSIEPMSKQKGYEKARDCPDLAFLYYLHTFDNQMSLINSEDQERLLQSEDVDNSIKIYLRSSFEQSNIFFNYYGLLTADLEKVPFEFDKSYSIIIDYEFSPIQIQKIFRNQNKIISKNLFFMPLDYLLESNFEDVTYHDMLSREIGNERIVLPSVKHLQLIPIYPRGTILCFQGARLIDVIYPHDQ